MEPEERSVAGIFMSFQTPVEIPGVSNIDFLNMAYNARRNKLGEPELGPIEVSISCGMVPYFSPSPSFIQDNNVYFHIQFMIFVKLK